MFKKYAKLKEVLTWENACFPAQNTLINAVHGKRVTQLQISAYKTIVKLGKIVILWSAKTDNVLSVSMDGLAPLSPNVQNPHSTSFNIIATHKICYRVQANPMLRTQLPHFGEKISFLKEHSTDHAIRSNH
jgi:hypothetical protein